MILDDLLACSDIVLGQIGMSHLSRYDQLQRSLMHTNVKGDSAFQRVFKGYYRVRRGPDWCDNFFSILEREKSNPALAFADVLAEVHRATGRVEASFSSKLVATIRPELPVYDRYVCENLALAIPAQYEPSARRIEQLIVVYDDLCRLMATLVKCDSFAKLRVSFDRKHPGYSHLTDIKKLDLLLWQYRQDRD